jgi:hypothetical protein
MLNFSTTYDAAIRTNDKMPHMGQRLNKLKWMVQDTQFLGKNLRVVYDNRVDLDQVCKCMNRVMTFFDAIGATMKYDYNELHIMYHQMDKHESGKAYGIGDTINYKHHSTIVFINSKDSLASESILEHELVHAFDYMTQHYLTRPHGSYKHEVESFDFGKPLDELVMTFVRQVLNDIQDYCNCPKENFVVEYFYHTNTKNIVTAMDLAHGMGERVIQLIDQAYRTNKLSKKRARALMLHYISYQKDKPNFKYLHHLARNTKAGKV